jgi:hypothetical protein
MTDERQQILAAVNKNFAGFAREIFTDTSQYMIRFDSLSGMAQEQMEHKGRALNLDERAVVLATAISIDFDYFSRHSGGHGLMGWFPFFGGGGYGDSASSGADEVPGAAGDVNVPPVDAAGTAASQTGAFGGSPWLSDDDAGVSSPSDAPMGGDSGESLWGKISDFLDDD